MKPRAVAADLYEADTLVFDGARFEKLQKSIELLTRRSNLGLLREHCSAGTRTPVVLC